MFERMRGGNYVGEGTYLNLKEGEFVSVPDGGDYLPGNVEHTFIKIPLALVLVLGPFLGLAFVIFLPMAVPLAVTMILVQRLKRQAPQLRDSAIQVTTFSQQPGLAYFEGTNPGGNERRGEAVAEDGAEDGKEVSATSLDELIDQLEDDIQQRREKGEK